MLESSQDNFSKTIKSFRNRIVLAFSEGFQTNITNKQKLDFRETINDYFKKNINSVYNPESVTNFIEGLIDSVRNYYIKHKKEKVKNENEKTVFDMSKAVNIVAICDELSDFLLDHVLKVHKYSDNSNSDEQAINFGELYLEYYINTEKEIQEACNKTKIFAEDISYSDDDVNNIESYLIKILHTAHSLIYNSKKRIINSEEIVQDICQSGLQKLFYDVNTGRVDGRFNIVFIVKIVAIFKEYLDNLLEKGDSKVLYEYLEKNKLFDESDIKFVTSVFAIKKAIRNFAEKDNAFLSRNSHLNHETIDHIIEFAQSALDELLNCMHGDAALLKWINDYDDVFMDIVNTIDDPSLKVAVYDLLKIFLDDIQTIAREQYINVSKNKKDVSSVNVVSDISDEGIEFPNKTIH